MSAKLKTHEAVGEDYLAGAKGPAITWKFSVPAPMVWAALLDPVAWTQWLPITKVTWTSPAPFGPGTTRTVEIGRQVVEETFFAWEEGRRMAFRFERSTLPVSAAVEDYQLVADGDGCELRWNGRASAPLLLGGLITGQLAGGIRKGLPELEKLIRAEPERFR